MILIMFIVQHDGLEPQLLAICYGLGSSPRELIELLCLHTQGRIKDVDEISIIPDKTIGNRKA
jgi:hypothetical protein